METNVQLTVITTTILLGVIVMKDIFILIVVKNVIMERTGLHVAIRVHPAPKKNVIMFMVVRL